MSLKVVSASDGKYNIVDAFGNVIQGGIDDLSRARAIAATRNAVGDEGKSENPEGEESEDEPS